MKHFVIAIAGDYGSQRRDVGMRLAEKLNVEFYDRDIVNEVAEKMGISLAEASEIDEIVSKKISVLSVLSNNDGNYMSHQVINNQEKVIQKLAERESCIIIGRCANYVLRDRDDVLKVKIYAPAEKRVNYILNIYPDMTYEKALSLLKKKDKQREAYHNYVTGKSSGDLNEQHIMYNSAAFTIDEIVDMLYEIIMKRFGD